MSREQTITQYISTLLEKEGERGRFEKEAEKYKPKSGLMTNRNEPKKDEPVDTAPKVMSSSDHLFNAVEEMSRYVDDSGSDALTDSISRSVRIPNVPTSIDRRTPLVDLYRLNMGGETEQGFLKAPAAPVAPSIDTEGKGKPSFAQSMINSLRSRYQEKRINPNVKSFPEQDSITATELDGAAVGGASDGKVDEGLMTRPYDKEAMLDINEPLGEPNVGKRSVEESENFDATEIQKALGATADGIIGNQTRKAIGEYQIGIGLPATGFVDRETLKAIRAGKEAVEPTSMSFTQESDAGQALSSVEDVYYNPYSLNHQPRLRGNRRHNSGLTIGAGFDLGQKNKQDLLNMDVSEDLADKLDKSGWLGLKPSNSVSGEQDRFRTAGHAEMTRLYREQASNGSLLTLTPSEIDELTEAEYNYKQEQIKKKYEDNGYGDWALVSDEAKIALTVEQYHRGNLGNSWKLFFEKAQQDDVKGITDLYLYPERANPVLRSLGIT